MSEQDKTKEALEADRIFEIYRRIFCLDIDDVEINPVNLKYIRQCAIIHVEGIINELNVFNNSPYLIAQSINGRLLYWQRVKQLIINK